MKKTFVFLVMLLCGTLTAAHAQFYEGTKAIGGGLGYSNNNTRFADGQDIRMSKFNVDLKGGYFVKDNLEAGLVLGLSTSSQEVDNNINAERMSSSTFLIGPYARLYNPLTEVIAIFGEAGMQFGFGGGDGQTRNVRLRTRSFSIGVRPGVSLMVNENLGLETSIGFIGYERVATGEKEGFDDNKIINGGFGFGFNLSDISLGFRLYLTD